MLKYTNTCCACARCKLRCGLSCMHVALCVSVCLCLALRTRSSTTSRVRREARGGGGVTVLSHLAREVCSEAKFARVVQYRSVHASWGGLTGPHVASHGSRGFRWRSFVASRRAPRRDEIVCDALLRGLAEVLSGPSSRGIHRRGIHRGGIHRGGIQQRHPSQRHPAKGGAIVSSDATGAHRK